MGTPSNLDLGESGLSRRQALRQLLTEFRHRGWEDSGDAALHVIERIALEPGVTAQRAAQAAPRVFLTVNQIRRQELADAIVDVVCRRRTR